MLDRDITLDDCYKLQAEFKKYCESAEQHQFTLLLMMDVKMTDTINCLEHGIDIKQSELHSMFNVITKIMHKSIEDVLEVQ